MASLTLFPSSVCINCRFLFESEELGGIRVNRDGWKVISNKYIYYHWLSCDLCRFAAKSCDEIGRIAAMFAVTGTWDTEIDQHLMTIKWRDD